MLNHSKNYRSILKGTAIFGSVQIFNVFVNLIRGKLIALILGPEGMGISSLLFTSINTIQQFSSCGLNLSAVKEVSTAKDESKKSLINVVIAIRRLLFVTSLLGVIVTIFLSKKISIWTFGNDEYMYHFMVLSIFVFFTTLSNGELAILQGLREVKRLAYSSVVGSLSGLLLGVPLYYIFGYDGIVPSMIILCISVFIFYRLYTNRIIKTKEESVKIIDLYPLFKQLASLGLIMMVSTLLGTLVIYILNMIIRHYGSIEDVGLFQAANSITNQYIGLVFTAMSLDFFPRLTSVSKDDTKVRELVNQQTEIILLIIAPLSILFIVAAPLIIKILLSKEFLVLIPVIKLMGIGILFKAFAFPMGYISFSKGDKKVFFWLEGIIGNVLLLVLNSFLYYNYGMVGLGIAFCITYIVISFIYIVITKSIYRFFHERYILYMLLVFTFLVVLTFIISLYDNSIISYFFMIIIFIITSSFSLYTLRDLAFSRKK